MIGINLNTEVMLVMQGEFVDGIFLGKRQLFCCSFQTAPLLPRVVFIDQNSTFVMTLPKDQEADKLRGLNDTCAVLSDMLVFA